MIVFPNAKINLGLQIVGRRSDGYHLLRTVFCPVPLYDSLEFVVRVDGGTEDSLEVRGDASLAVELDNLVLKATKALRCLRPIPYLHIYLHKAIPSGAGMGGGSADASFMLRGLRDEFAPDLSDEELETLALSLGADCPFFIRNTPALGEGIGEQLQPLGFDPLAGWHLVVVKPDLHISTREAFAGLGELLTPEESLEELIRLHPSSWRGRLVNDFERSLYPQYPILSNLLERLYSLGAVYASMTGSGAALYGLFDREVEGLASHFEQCFVWQSRL